MSVTIAVERGPPARLRRRGPARRDVRAVVSFQSPLFLLALLAVPLLLAFALLDGPAPRALPGRVHEHRRARERRRAEALVAAAGCRSCCFLLALTFAAGALARPRTHLTVPEDNATVDARRRRLRLDARRRRRADAPRRRDLGDARRSSTGCRSGSRSASSRSAPSRRCCRRRRATGRRSATRSATCSPRRAPRSATGSRSGVRQATALARARRRRSASRASRCRPRSCCSRTARRTAAGSSRSQAAEHARDGGDQGLHRRARHARRRRLVRLRALRQLDPGAARPADDARDRAHDRRQDVHGADVGEALERLQRRSARASAAAASCARSPRGSSPPRPCCCSARSRPARFWEGRVP